MSLQGGCRAGTGGWKALSLLAGTSAEGEEELGTWNLLVLQGLNYFAFLAFFSPFWAPSLLLLPQGHRGFTALVVRRALGCL